MKTFTSSILFLLLHFACYCCLSCMPEDENNAGNAGLQCIDSLQLALNKQDPLQSKAMFYHEELGKRYLVMDNEKSRRKIQFYNLDTRIHEVSVPLYSEGPHSIPLNDGFHVLSMDSILIPAVDSRIYLINRQGEVTRIYPYDSNVRMTLDDGNTISVSSIISLSLFHSPMIRNGKYLYAPQMAGFENYQDNDNPEKFKLCFRLDLKSGKATIMPACFPKSFWSDGMRGLEYSWTYDGDKFVISPVYSHDLFTSKDNKVLEKAATAPSKYVRRISGYNPGMRGMDFSKYINRKLQYQEYLGIMYDPFRKVYYRFFWPGIINVPGSQEMQTELWRDPPNFGITVLNEKFEILSETILPVDIYSQHHYFVAKEGLYIAANHPRNPNLKEDVLSFHIYGLKGP